MTHFPSGISPFSLNPPSVEISEFLNLKEWEIENIQEFVNDYKTDCEKRLLDTIACEKMPPIFYVVIDFQQTELLAVCGDTERIKGFIKDTCKSFRYQIDRAEAVQLYYGEQDYNFYCIKPREWQLIKKIAEVLTKTKECLPYTKDLFDSVEATCKLN